MRIRREPVRLTDTFVSGLLPEPGKDRVVIQDSEAHGLEIRVSTASGSGRAVRSWTVRYKPKGEEPRRKQIGLFPGMTTEAARGRAMSIVGAAKQGRDLLAEEDKAKAAARIAAERPKTVKELIARYLAQAVDGKQRKADQTRRVFELHVLADTRFCKLTPGEVRLGDVVSLLDHLEHSKGLVAQRNRVRSQLVALFKWAEEKDWIPSNPARKARRIKEPDPQEHGRLLSDDELRAIWLATEKLTPGSNAPGPGEALVKLLMLTGNRRNEIQKAPRRELSKDLSQQTIPGSRYKTKRPHLVMLPTQAVDIIKAMPVFGPYLVTANGKKPYAGEGRLKRRLDKLSGVKGWKYHDLRRSVRTGLSRLQVPLDVRWAVLGHGHIGSNDATYDMYKFQYEKQDALQRWADHLQRVIESGDNVVSLETRRGVA